MSNPLLDNLGREGQCTDRLTVHIPQVQILSRSLKGRLRVRIPSAVQPSADLAKENKQTTAEKREGLLHPPQGAEDPFIFRRLLFLKA